MRTHCQFSCQTTVPQSVGCHDVSENGSDLSALNVQDLRRSYSNDGKNKSDKFTNRILAAVSHCSSFARKKCVFTAPGPGSGPSHRFRKSSFSTSFLIPLLYRFITYKCPYLRASFLFSFGRIVTVFFYVALGSWYFMDKWHWFLMVLEIHIFLIATSLSMGFE